MAKKLTLYKLKLNNSKWTFNDTPETHHELGEFNCFFNSNDEEGDRLINTPLGLEREKQELAVSHPN